MNILRIDSSIFGSNGVSSGLTERLTQGLAEVQGASVTQRTLDGKQLPHFSAETISQIGEGKAELADTLIAELQEADTLVLGVPMYNFGIPSELKSWFDHVARAGTTFKYTESGPVGLLTDKKVYVVTSRGGFHKDAASDVETPYLNIMLGFLGLKDVSFIYAEGLNLGGDSKEQALKKAHSEIDALINQSTQA